MSDKYKKLLRNLTRKEQQELYNQLIQEREKEEETPFIKIEEMTSGEHTRYISLQTMVVAKIEQERRSQMEKWGYQRHGIETWMTILMEEIGEVFQAINSTLFSGKESDAENIQEELIQSGAVIVAILEQLEEETLWEKYPKSY